MMLLAGCGLMSLLAGPFGNELKYKSKMLNDFTVVGEFSSLRVVVGFVDESLSSLVAFMVVPIAVVLSGLGVVVRASLVDDLIGDFVDGSLVGVLLVVVLGFDVGFSVVVAFVVLRVVV